VHDGVLMLDQLARQREAGTHDMRRIVHRRKPFLLHLRGGHDGDPVAHRFDLVVRDIDGGGQQRREFAESLNRCAIRPARGTCLDTMPPVLKLPDSPRALADN
jgi:hypothetical protein